MAHGTERYQPGLSPDQRGALTSAPIETSEIHQRPILRLRIQIQSLVTACNACRIAVTNIIGAAAPIHYAVGRTGACSLFSQAHSMSDLVTQNFLQECPII